MYKYCNGTIKYYGANSLPLSTNLGGQEELVDYSFLCQTQRESSDPFFSSWNGQYLTVHNILYCNVLSEDSCPASARVQSGELCFGQNRRPQNSKTSSFFTQ